MKKIFIIFLPIILLMMAGCSKEISSLEQSEDAMDSNTISVQATMPIGTRVALTQNILDMELTWEENDQLHLVFVDGGVIETQTVMIRDISADKRSAIFDITIPEGITSDLFDIYGVHGNITFSSTPGEEHLAVLPTSWSGESLADIMGDDLVMLRFAMEDFDKTSTAPRTAYFSHVGSLFSIQLKNIGNTGLSGVTGLELSAATPIGAHKSTGTAAYNPIDGTFTGTSTTETSLPFTIAETELLAGRTMEIWGWYPFVEGSTWPSINLRVNAGSPIETAVSKEPKNATIGLGRVYYLFAEYNEGVLSFSTPVTDYDGNIYKTVVIKDKGSLKREWMVENLRTTTLNDGTPIPNVTNDAEWAVLTTPGYCWYQNDRKTHAQPYGALYNWYVVETGKLCPEGWKVPSRTEFNSYLRDALGGVSEAGAKIKSTGTIEDGTGLWRSPNTGATNESGFTAVPNGVRHAAGSFQYKDQIGYLWSSTLNSPTATTNPNDPARLTLSNTSATFSTGYLERNTGYGVRCVRDN